jgi:hypothetical protein
MVLPLLGIKFRIDLGGWLFSTLFVHGGDDNNTTFAIMVNVA